MSKSNTWENELLLLLFNNVSASLIGDAGGLPGSVVEGSLYVSLHTADPGEAGTQSTNEATYGGYARVGVARNAGGWTVSGNQASNTTAITFAECSSGSNLVTHFGIGTDAAGAGKLLYKGDLSPAITVSAGVTPQIPAGGLDVTEE